MPRSREGEMSIERTIDLYDLDEKTREAIAECEVTGARIHVRRGEQPVAVILSVDELISLRETLALLNDERLRREIETAEEQARRGALLEAVDVIAGGDGGGDADGADLPRLRFAERIAEDVGASKDQPHLRALLARLDSEPICGSPLLDPLRGKWVAFEHDLRVIYLLSNEARHLVVLKIARREPQK